jgi:hypothetical protein
MNYILIHEHEHGVTAHPFNSKLKTVLADHTSEEVAKILGVDYDATNDSESVSTCAVEARPLNFDAMLAAETKTPGE